MNTTNNTSSVSSGLLKLTLSTVLLVSSLFLSSCGSQKTTPPPSPVYSQAQRQQWQNYIAVSPLSTDIQANSNTVSSQASTILPLNYNEHIREVAEHIQSTQIAQRSYQAQMGKITGNYEAAREVAPRFGIESYKLLRGNQRKLSVGDAFGGLFSIWAAQGIVESNYRNQLQSAFINTMQPVLQNGKRLVLAENALTRAMSVAPTKVLAQKVQSHTDAHYRQLIAGTWKETSFGLLTPRVWLFGSDGSYQSENPITKSQESGRWVIQNQILTLQTKFGPTQYRIEQSGKKILMVNVRDQSKKTLRFVGSSSRDYQNLLRTLKGNTRYNVRF